MYLISQILKNLSPDLLKPKYRSAKHPLAGHCYVASEAAYYLFAKSVGYKPYFIRHEQSPHWFLQRNTCVIDLTKDQFKSPVPYEKAVCKGFLTKQPSKRARILIDRALKGNRNVKIQ